MVSWDSKAAIVVGARGVVITLKSALYHDDNMNLEPLALRSLDGQAVELLRFRVNHCLCPGISWRA
jgi:hypothetical protein